MSAPLDLRLVPSALAAWGAAAVVVVLPVHLALGLGAVCASVPVVVAVGAARRSSARQRARAPRDASRAVPREASPDRPRATPPDASRGTVRGQLLLTCGVVAAVLLAGAAQLAARDDGDLRGLAEAGRPVLLGGTVTSEPVELRSGPPDAPPRYRATLAVDKVGVGGEGSAEFVPVLVLTGAPWPDAAYGSRVVVEGRLSPGDPGRRETALLSAEDVPRLVEGPPALLGAVDAVRAGLRRACTGLGIDARALVPGIAVGDTSALTVELRDAMRVAGLTHVTAVSGAHFSIVGACVLVLCAAARLPRRARAGVVCLVMVGFVALVHPSPSVLRAAAMGAVGLAALVLGRPARSVAALATAVVVLLVVDPWLARELGFVLSVAATSGLVLLAGPLARRWAGSVRAPAAYALAVPVAAQSVCAPIVLLISPTVALYAVPANILVAPAVAPATVLGLLAALVSPWWHGAAVVLAQVAGAACWWIALVARTAASLPGAQVAWPEGALGVVLLAAGTTAALVLGLGRGRGDARQGSGTAPDRAGGARRPPARPPTSVLRGRLVRCRPRPAPVPAHRPGHAPPRRV